MVQQRHGDRVTVMRAPGHPPRGTSRPQRPRILAAAFGARVFLATREWPPAAGTPWTPC